MTHVPNYLRPLLSFLLLWAFVAACDNTNDDLPANPLAGVAPLNLPPSTIKINGSTYAMEESDLEVNGDGFIITLYKHNPKIAFSFTNSRDGGPDGEKARIVFDGKEYIGENLTVQPVGSNAARITGTLSEDNGTGSVTFDADLYEESLYLGTSRIMVQGNKAYITGSIGSNLHNQILELADKHRNVRTLVLQQIPGTVNNSVTQNVGHMIRLAGYATHLEANSFVASGGTSLFCAGQTRTLVSGAQIGVHSWCCFEGMEGWELPNTSQGHTGYLSYWKEMLGDKGRDFYFFYIHAATLSEMHILTPAEIQQYGITTN